MLNTIARLIRIENNRQLRKAITETNEMIKREQINRAIEKCERIENEQIQWHKEQIQYFKERMNNSNIEKLKEFYKERIEWHKEQIDFLSK